MTSRRMYAPRGWEKLECPVFVDRDTYTGTSSVPVLVSDAEGMPDFKPGDRVQSIEHGEWTVTHVPIRMRDDWWVPAWRGDQGYRCARASSLTKLPRETSVLLRVTGPEDKVESAVERVYGHDLPDSLRVERVEDPDAKGGER